MAVIPLKAFSGEIPRTSAHLLPDNSAQSAINCDLAYGELKGLKQTSLVRAMGISPSSFYTDDGNAFYAWTKQVEAAQSPVIGDVHRRLYYTLQNGTDIRAVARTGIYSEPPYALGKTPVGYKVGVPGPTAVMFADRAALHARLINYETTADHINISGYDWIPIVDGLTLSVKFFYEHDGVKYQETDVLPIYSGAYGAVPFVSLQPHLKYADAGAPNNGNVNIYGRDFHVAFPAKRLSPIEKVSPITHIEPIYAEDGSVSQFVNTTANEVVTTTKATPAEAKPVLLVTGSVNGSQVFSVYSEGSAFASARGPMSAKLSYHIDDAREVLYCGLKYGVMETRAYVYTHVNIFGEESTPSDPVLVDIGYGQTVELYCRFQQTDSPGQPHDYAPIKSIRVYGTNTTSQGNTDFYFVSESEVLPGGVFSPTSLFDFSAAQPTKPEDFGERITTIDYGVPPAGSDGICALPNGFFAVHRDTDQGFDIPGIGQNEVWFSEPYHPYAYPSKYVMSFPWAVVGIKPQGNGLLVITKGHPYFVFGVHPDSMSQIKLPTLQAGISKRAIADVGQYVVYASHDGLVAVSNTDVNLELSQRFFTRDTWRTLYGANLKYLVLAYHDGYLVGYFTNGAQGFVIRMDEATGTFTKADITATCHFVSVESDLLYLASGNALYSYGTGARRAYTWHSKDFILPYPTCFGAGQIIMDGAESGAVSIYVYADGALKATVSMSASGEFRLPSGFTARRWSVKLVGSRTVKEIYLANAMSELSNV